MGRPLHCRRTRGPRGLAAVTTLAAAPPMLARYSVVRHEADGDDALPPDGITSLRQHLPRVARQGRPAAHPPSPRRVQAERHLTGSQQAQDLDGLHTAILIGPDAVTRAPSQELILRDGGHALLVGYADAPRGPRVDDDTNKIRERTGARHRVERETEQYVADGILNVLQRGAV